MSDPIHIYSKFPENFTSPKMKEEKNRRLFLMQYYAAIIIVCNFVHISAYENKCNTILSNFMWFCVIVVKSSNILCDVK